MSVLKIRQALEVALNNVAPALTPVWEDMDFVPVPDVAYQEVHLLPAEPENPSVGGSFTRERGFFQVTLNYPKGGGVGAAAARAELLKTVFYRGASFAKDGITVVVSGTPYVMAGYIDRDRYSLPVRIPYFSNIQG